MCLLCGTCSVRTSRLNVVQTCCNSFFIGAGLKALVHANPRNLTLLVLDVSLDSVVPLDDPNHPNVQMVDATKAWNELVTSAVPSTLFSRLYLAPAASAAVPVAAPGSGTTTTTTTTTFSISNPDGGEVDLPEVNRAKRQKAWDPDSCDSRRHTNVTEAATLPFISQFKISDMAPCFARLRSVPAAHKPAHSVRDLLWDKLKLGTLGLSGAVRLARLGEAHKKPKDALSVFICQGVAQVVQAGQAMLKTSNDTMLRFIYSLALDDLNVGADGSTTHRTFNAVAESTAKTRENILSRVLMVDCARGGVSTKPLEDAYARAQRELMVYGQTIGKRVVDISSEEATKVTLPFAVTAIVNLLFAAVSITKESCGLNGNAPLTRAYLSQILTVTDQEAAMQAVAQADEDDDDPASMWVTHDAVEAAGVSLASPSIIAHASNAMMFGFRLSILHALHWNAASLNDLSKLQGSLALQYHANFITHVKHLDMPSLVNNVVTQYQDGSLHFATSEGDSFGAKELTLGVCSLTEEVIDIVSEFVAESSYQSEEDEDAVLHELFVLIRRGRLSNKFQVAMGASGIGPAAGESGRGFTLLARIVRQYINDVEPGVENRRGRFFELWEQYRVAVMALIQLTGLYDYSEWCARPLLD